MTVTQRIASGRASSTAKTIRSPADPSSDMRFYKKVNDHTLELTAKKAGKVTTTGRIVVSADGKTPHGEYEGDRFDGTAFHNTAVCDKQ